MPATNHEKFSMRKNVLIMGAAGRDFHNFNLLFKDKPNYRVRAFTATQLPLIAERLFPQELAGSLYPRVKVRSGTWKPPTNYIPCDLVLFSTPIHLCRLLSCNKPTLRVRYEYQDFGEVTLEKVLEKRLATCPGF